MIEDQKIEDNLNELKQYLSKLTLNLVSLFRIDDEIREFISDNEGCDNQKMVDFMSTQSENIKKVAVSSMETCTRSLSLCISNENYLKNISTNSEKNS